MLLTNKTTTCRQLHNDRKVLCFVLQNFYFSFFFYYYFCTVCTVSLLWVFFLDGMATFDDDDDSRSTEQLDRPNSTKKFSIIKILKFSVFWESSASSKTLMSCLNTEKKHTITRPRGPSRRSNDCIVRPTLYDIGVFSQFYDGTINK